MKIALLLTAYDKMSGVVGGAMDKSKQKMQEMEGAVRKMRDGFLLLETAKQGFNLLQPTIDAYEEMELAGARLKASMMKDGGILDENMYKKMYKYSQEISDHYSGSTADYLDMMRVLKNNSITESDILGGIGVGVEKLGLLFNMKPAAIGEFAAHMRNDMGVAVKDMERVMDLTARVHNIGVGKTGEEAVYEMNQFFSKVGLGLVNLKTTGLQASQEIGALGAIFMRKGISGESVGTNFRRILDGLRDPAKIKKANEEAAKFNKTLEFYDKSGRFKGVAEFAKELDKLRGLPTTAIAEILKPFSGRQGLSTDFLELLANDGAKEFNHMQESLMKQATLDQKITPILATYSKQKQILASTWENTKAAIGAVIVPKLIQFAQWLNVTAVNLRKFIEHHPAITKIGVAIVAVSSALIGLAGIVKIFQGALAMVNLVFKIGAAIKWLRIAFVMIQPSLWSLITATWAWTVALLANPITWIILGIVALGAAVYMLIKHWDKVSAFFSDMWKKVKAYFAVPIQIIKTMLLNFTPVGLIFKHWKTIVHFFSFIWDKAKQIFWNALTWIFNLGTKFYDAGRNIINSIGKGIVSLAHKPVEAIKNMVGKIRNLLPFSPAKDGPLKDIHKVRLIETIADSIKPTALISKMQKVAGMIFNVQAPQGIASMIAQGAGGGTSVQLHYAPTITFAGNTSAGIKEDFMRVVKEHASEISEIVSKKLNNDRRKY